MGHHVHVAWCDLQTPSPKRFLRVVISSHSLYTVVKRLRVWSPVVITIIYNYFGQAWFSISLLISIFIPFLAREHSISHKASLVIFQSIDQSALAVFHSCLFLVCIKFIRARARKLFLISRPLTVQGLWRLRCDLFSVGASFWGVHHLHATLFPTFAKDWIVS